MARLALDPGDRQLHSITWATETYGVVHTTAVGDTGCQVVWVVSTDEDSTLEIIYVGSESPPL